MRGRILSKRSDYRSNLKKRNCYYYGTEPVLRVTETQDERSGSRRNNLRNTERNRPLQSYVSPFSTKDQVTRSADRQHRVTLQLNIKRVKTVKEDKKVEREDGKNSHHFRGVREDSQYGLNFRVSEIVVVHREGNSTLWQLNRQQEVLGVETPYETQ